MPLRSDTYEDVWGPYRFLATEPLRKLLVLPGGSAVLALTFCPRLRDPLDRAVVKVLATSH